jgi:hypothetical protein
VAALQPDKYLVRPLYERPAGVAAIGIFVVTIAIVWKIYREHRIHADIGKERARIAKQLASLPEAKDIIPKKMLPSVAGRGFVWSLAVVITSSVVSRSNHFLSVVGS